MKLLFCCTCAAETHTFTSQPRSPLTENATVYTLPASDFLNNLNLSVVAAILAAIFLLAALIIVCYDRLCVRRRTIPRHPSTRRTKATPGGAVYVNNRPIIPVSPSKSRHSQPQRSISADQRYDDQHFNDIYYQHRQRQARYYHHRYFHRDDSTSSDTSSSGDYEYYWKPGTRRQHRIHTVSGPSSNKVYLTPEVLRAFDAQFIPQTVKQSKHRKKQQRIDKSVSRNVTRVKDERKADDNEAVV